MRTPNDTYRNHTMMTLPGHYAGAMQGLPDDVESLVHMIQQLIIYDVVALDFYGFRVPESRRDEIHFRSTERLLAGILALEDKPLTAARSLDRRLVGRCHHFMLLLVAMLRENGVPARARCGFGSYFNPPNFEDHWVCEYWNQSEERWVLVDAQFDEIWRTRLHIAHDILDVSRDHFLVAADAWIACRTEKADPARFGISFENLRGLWYIAGNLVRDVAALNGMEMLPWDVWGAQPQPNELLDSKQLQWFDHLAEVSREPDAQVAELRALYSDPRLRVPHTVFNALRKKNESLEVPSPAEVE